MRLAGPPLHLTTESVYGDFVFEGGTYTLTLPSLKAQQPYTLFLLAEDRESLLSEVLSLEFTTVNRYPAASFSLTLYQSEINEA